MSAATSQEAEVASWLKRRAESYSSDALTFKAMGETENWVLYSTIAAELRKCATEISL